ncbi:MAG: hypothetical protein V9E82_02725 [Candidatus Nanopelagicales bacterium]
MNLLDLFGRLPFTRREAMDAGLSRYQWELALSQALLHKVRAGVYLAVLDADPRVRHCQMAAAAMKARSNYMACSGSALAILGLPNPYCIAQAFGSTGGSIR